MQRTWTTTCGLAAALFVLQSAGGQSTVRISANEQGEPANDFCQWVNLSRTGRFVAFTSSATNLQPGSPTIEQVYLLDRDTGELEMVSVNDKAEPGDGFSWSSAVSEDGRHVAFHTGANNIAGGVSGAMIRDRVAGTTRSLQIRHDGVVVSEPGPVWGRIAMTPDGRYIAFDARGMLVQGDTSNRDIYVHDRDTDNDRVFDEPGEVQTVRVSVNSQGVASDGESRYPHMSPDGRFVTFMSYGANLAPGDTNNERDIFLHDRDTDGDGIFDEPGQIATERINVTSSGAQTTGFLTYWSSVSADGRFVTFHSDAVDLVPGDQNKATDVFLRDRLLGTTERISLSFTGGEANGGAALASMSEDGRFVAYTSQAGNSFPLDLNDVAMDAAVYDRLNRTTKLASYTSQNVQGDGLLITPLQQMRGCTISPDGRLIAFVAATEDMCAPPTPIMNAYLRDRGPGFLADVDGAGSVDADDLVTVILQWGPCPAAPAPCFADLDGSGQVDADDLIAVILNWG